jgi:hypothetical protein
MVLQTWEKPLDEGAQRLPRALLHGVDVGLITRS